MSSGLLGNCFSKLCNKNASSLIYLSVRHARTRHRVTRFCIMNNYQPWAKPVNIKEVFGNVDSSNPAEVRDYLRRNGLLPPKMYTDRPINMNCSMDIFDRFLPPEGDGKSSFISISKAKETKESIEASLKNLKETRTIRKYDSEFNRTKFVDTGDSMYRQVLDILPNYRNNEGKLLELVTEKGLSDMLRGMDNKTLVHSFNKHLEPPSLISVRTQGGLADGQLFAQVILRFFSEQTIAIYDRFGRIIYGSADAPQDVLEYVVFEKQVSEEFGMWRIHGKLIPQWLTKKLVYHRTMRHEPQAESSDSTDAKV